METISEYNADGLVVKIQLCFKIKVLIFFENSKNKICTYDIKN